MHKWLLAATCLLLAGCSTAPTPVSTAPISTAPMTPAPSAGATDNAPGTVDPSSIPAALPSTPAGDETILTTQGRSSTKTTTCPTMDDTNIRAVRFDPSYYYGTGLSAAQLADQLTSQWAQNGVNMVYFMAYNATYGARYQTTYTYNTMEDWGRLDLLGAMLKSAASRNIRVVAWISDFRHGGAIAQNPAWASLNKAGGNYGIDGDLQFMTLASSAAESWYQGFIKDLLTRYPALHGVDIAEPVVNWWGDEADYSAAMTSAFTRAYPGEPLGGAKWRAYRAARLTQHLQNTIKTVRGLCKSVHLTMPLTADAQGNLLGSATLASETGFDLDGLLSGSVKPDVMNIELMWQQWKASYGTAVFTPQWTATATAQARSAVAGRTKLVVHVETTPFGEVTPTPDQLQDALQAALQGGADGLDVYHTQRIDTEQAWPNLAAVYTPTKTQ